MEMVQEEFKFLEGHYPQMIEAYKRSQLTKIPKAWIIPDEIIRQKQKSSSVIDFIKDHKLLTLEELTITEVDLKILMKQLQVKKWSCLEVVRAFAHRASLAHQLVNCLTEILFESAFKRASELDNYYDTEKVSFGKFHGVPISIKDEFDISGERTTLGLISQIASPPSTRTSPNIQILIDNGAIPIVKTNVPTGAFNIVTRNNLFGSTLNPYQLEFTSGGSSGGESALVALRGSALGIATDLGGSIRQPCSFTGLFGMKPTSNRVPHFNEKTVVRGMESLSGTNGCLSNDLFGVSLYFSTIVESKPWLTDTKVVPIEWKKNIELGEILTIGILIDDGVIRPTPPVKRALDKIRDILILQGLENCKVIIKYFEPSDGLLSEIASFADKFMNSGGLKKLYDEINKTGEHVENIEQIKSTHDLLTSELWKLQDERSLKVNELWKYWNSLGLDCLISPVTALAGCRFDEFFDASYSPLANVLDFPSCVFPVLKADAAIDIKDPLFRHRNETEKKVWDCYDPKLSNGVPVGLQLIGAKYQEEKVLRIVELISKKLKSI